MICPEALARRCTVKKVLLKISQNSQENTCARASVLDQRSEIKTDDYLLFYTFFLWSHQVETKVAKCKPVANIYDGALNTFVCDNIIQNFVSVYYLSINYFYDWICRKPILLVYSLKKPKWHLFRRAFYSNTIHLSLLYMFNHETIIRKRITCNKISCYMCDSVGS